MEKMKVAFIGNGKAVNRYHLPYLKVRKDTIEVAYIYDNDLSRTDWERMEGVTYTDDLNKVLNSDVDLIIVATPPMTHFELGKKVLNAHKNCIIEKPFTSTVKEAEELFALAEKNKVLLQCNQNRRFDSDYLTMKKVLESGKLGKVYEINSCFDRYRKEYVEGKEEYHRAEALVYDLGPHFFDQIVSYFGLPEEVNYDVVQLKGSGRLQDYFDFDFFYPDFKVSVQSSYLRAHSRERFSIYGENGTFIKKEIDKQETFLKKYLFPGSEGFGLDTPEDYGTIYYGDGSEEKVVSEVGDYGRYYDALYEVIKKGKKPFVKKETTLFVMKLLEESTATLD